MHEEDWCKPLYHIKESLYSTNIAILIKQAQLPVEQAPVCLQKLAANCLIALAGWKWSKNVTFHQLQGNKPAPQTLTPWALTVVDHWLITLDRLYRKCWWITISFKGANAYLKPQGHKFWLHLCIDWLLCTDEIEEKPRDDCLEKLCTSSLEAMSSDCSCALSAASSSDLAASWANLTLKLCNSSWRRLFAISISIHLARSLRMAATCMHNLCQCDF